MTWTKLGDDFFEAPAMLGLSCDAQLVRVQGLVWCNRHLTDGAIPTAALTRLTDSPTASESAAQLVEAGFWRVTPTGWEVVGFLGDQVSREEVLKARELKATRQDRWLRHRRGDHSRCSPRYCRDASPDGSAGASGDASGDGPPPRPDPSRAQAKGTGSGRDRPFGLSASVVPPDPDHTAHHLPPLLPMTVVMGEVDGTLDDDDALEPEPDGDRPW